MADLTAQIAEAKKNGYSDAEIAGYLGQSHPDLAPKIKEATANGYSPTEIVDHLSSMPAAPSAGGFLQNVANSAGSFLNNAVQAAAHPGATLQALGDTIEGAGQKYIPGYAALVKATGGDATAMQHQQAMAQALVDQEKNRYGSVDAIKHTLYTDPVGVLADVATVAAPLGGAAKVAEIAADAAKLGRVAEAARAVQTLADTAKAADPVSLAGNAVKGGVALVAPDAGTMATRLYQSALKPSLAKKNVNKVAQQVQTGLTNNIPVSEGGLDQVRDMISDLNDEIANRIKDGTAKGVTIDPVAVANKIDEIRDFFKNQATPDADLSALDKAKAEFIANHFTAGTPAVAPKPTGVLDANGNMIMTQGTPAVPGQAIPIPADVAQQMKQGTYAQLKNNYGKLSSADTEAQKALARGLKEELVKAFPEIGDLNDKESKFLDFEGQLAKAVSRISNKDVVGIGTPIAMEGAAAIANAHTAGLLGVMKSILDNPAIKSRIAIALDASKNKKPGMALTAAKTVASPGISIGSRIQNYLNDLSQRTAQPALAPAQ